MRDRITMTNKEKKNLHYGTDRMRKQRLRDFFSGWEISGTCGKTEPFASQLLRTMQYRGGGAFGRRIQCNGIFL